MKRNATAGLVALMVAPLAGCPLVTNQTSVRLVNDTAFPVDVTIFIDQDQLTLREVLTRVGTELRFTVLAGQTTTFSRACDDLQAIVIDNATLRVLGGLGPSDESASVLRDGSDFGCGDTITYTFTGTVTDVDIASSVAAG